MRKTLILTLPLLAFPVAFATDLELGAGYSPGSPHFKAEISNFEVSDSTALLLGVSNQAVWLGASTALDASVAGNVNASLKALYAWNQQYRLEGKANGVLGSKATVNVQAHYGTAPLSTFNRFAAFTENPEADLAGWGINLDGKYRLDRQWTLALEAGAGTSTYAQISAQYREPDTEYRIGTVWQKNQQGNVFGVAAGATFKTEDTTFTLDALVGTNGTLPVWGSRASVGAYGLEDLFGSDLKVFAAYEPYKDSTFPFRYGFETDTPLENGEVQFSAYLSQGGYAVRGSYKFNLNPEPEETDEAEEELNP